MSSPPHRLNKEGRIWEETPSPSPPRINQVALSSSGPKRSWWRTALNQASSGLIGGVDCAFPASCVAGRRGHRQQAEWRPRG